MKNIRHKIRKRLKSTAFTMKREYDYIIIGAGILGLSIAHRLMEKDPGAKVLILDKEREEATHASGRNSGVLHAGFYYTSDSLKARFTVSGNQQMKDYCRKKKIKVNNCGKLVVAQNKEDLIILKNLEGRGKQNGSRVKIISKDKALSLEPNIKTYKEALYSPDTASLNPREVCSALKEDLIKEGVHFCFYAKYLRHKKNTIETTQGDFYGTKIINCGGLYAEKIAQDFEFGHMYTIIPFKGLYLKYTKNTTD